jgi:transposase
LLAQSGKPQKQIRRFGCTTCELRELVAWLQGFGIEHVAMESTGVYWKPVWNILEGHFQILLANAQHIKAVPGRKTDTKDCQWIAELLQHGLLRGSFIPPCADFAIYAILLGREPVCRRSILGLQTGFKKSSKMPTSSWRV